MQTTTKRRKQTQPPLTPQPSIDPLGLPATARRRAATLLNQQCWCWGYDVRRHAGNLLIAHGFERYRVPQGQQGSSAYTLSLGSGKAVVLWGFGVFYGDQSLGGLYVRREGFNPRLLHDSAPPSCVCDCHTMDVACTSTDKTDQRCLHTLLIDALHWIAAYERWVIATIGLQYRQEAVSAWRKNTLVAGQIAAAWEEVAGQCIAHRA